MLTSYDGSSRIKDTSNLKEKIIYVQEIYSLIYVDLKILRNKTPLIPGPFTSPIYSPCVLRTALHFLCELLWF